MLLVFIILLLATIMYGLYYIIYIVVDKKSKKNLSEEETVKLEELSTKSSNFRTNIMTLLLIVTFLSSFFVWTDSGDNKSKIEVGSKQSSEEISDENSNDSAIDEEKNLSYEVLGNYKDKENKEQEIVIKIPEEVLKNEIKDIMVQVAKDELSKSNLEKAKVVAINENKKGKTIEEKKQTVSELEYTKDGNIKYEKYFKNKLVEKGYR